MALETWLTYIAAVLLLMSTPGPSQLLMLSNSMANGFRRSLSTAAGDLTANVLQMLAAGLGLGAIVLASENAFLVVKWLGVAYLVWMGVSKLRSAGRARGTDTLLKAHRTSLGRLWLQRFVTSAANPKAIVFFAALLPPFISAGAEFWSQFALLSVTYVVLDGLFLSLYGGGAAWIVQRMDERARIWLDRLSGGLLVAAGVLLGFKTIAREP